MIGNKIKLLRKQNDLSQIELAKKLGIARSTLSEYESGKIIPPIDKIRTLSDMFGISIDYLTGESSDVIVDHKQSIDIGEQLSNIADLLQIGNHDVNVFGMKLNQETKEIIAAQINCCLKTAKILSSGTQVEQ